MTVLLRLTGVGKRYGARRGRRSALEEQWALRDVDLEVGAGEVVSVIGRNGAGKSTLLKLATGVTAPSEGLVRRVERVAPLIEVGAGFHPDLSGRDNVQVNGRLLGLTGREVAAAFDDIVAFAELQHAIDRPVQSYSSGMFMRLAFSVAIHTRPQLLLVDEVLAVGDMPFQVRCLERITALRDDGVGVLLVSHNLAAVQEVSGRCLLLDGGRKVSEGVPSEVIAAYHLALSAATSGPGGSAGAHDGGAGEGEPLVLLSAGMRGQDGSSREVWEPGSEVVVSLRLRAQRDTPAAIFGFHVTSETAGHLMRWHNGLEAQQLPALAAGQELEVQLALRLALGAGGYGFDVGIVSRDWTTVLLDRPLALQFAVAHRGGAKGLVDLEPRLHVAGL